MKKFKINIILTVLLILLFSSNVVLGNNILSSSDISQNIEENKIESNNLENDNTESEQEQITSNIEAQKSEEKSIQVLSEDINSISNEKIEPGIYEIYTKVNDTKVININNSDKSNCANVNINERLNQNNQKFKVSVDKDGYYTFTCINSNKVLDVQSAGKVSGTNVWQYEQNNTDAQKWIIKSSGNGFYNIISKLNGLYLDILAGQDANGQNIQVYKGNDTNAQKFKLLKVMPTSEERTISDGTYWIYSNVANNRLLEVPNQATNNEAVLKTATNSSKANQKFRVTYNNDGTYSIMLLHTGKAVDVKGASGKNSTPVQQYDSNGTDAQKWILLKNEDDTYSIISKCNGLALDIQAASTAVGSSVQTYHFNGSNAQKFQFKECTQEQGSQDLEDGTFRILTKTGGFKVFDVEQVSKNNRSKNSCMG